MKNLLKILGILAVVLIAGGAVMAVLDVCPPQGPWPMPPWCPGSTIPWPFSAPDAISAADTGVGDGDGNSPADPGDASADTMEAEETDQAFDDSISENERLARVAIGLMEDLYSVNSYFSDAAASVAAVGSSGASGSGGAESSGLEAGGMVPSGFMDPLPDSGYIPAPPGACAAGASPSASFLNQGGEKITPELLAAKDIQVIDFQTLTGGSIDGRQLETTITSLITPGDQSLGTPTGWNQNVWSKMTEFHKPAESLMDYHLWTVSNQIEAEVVASMAATLEGMGLPSQVIDAFQNSQKTGWFAGSIPQEGDRISAMEIEAVFSGRTEGTIYEKRDFSIPDLGQMPEFGPMDGEGNVVFHDPDYGDYPFDLDIEWTHWDELGRVTAGTIVFSDEENGVLIEMEIFEDNSREAHVFRDGMEVGIIYVDINGEITYLDQTQ